MPYRMKTILTRRVETGSENKLQRQLDLSRRAVGGLNLSGAGIERRSREDLRVGRQELERWMIEDVECLRAELQIEPLRNPKILVQGVVKIPEIGTDDRVPTGISVCAERLQGEAARIEPCAQRLEA